MANWIQLQSGLNSGLSTAGQIMDYWQGQDRLGLARDAQRHQQEMQREQNTRLNAAEARAQETFDIAKVDRSMKQAVNALQEYGLRAQEAGIDQDEYFKRTPEAINAMAEAYLPNEVLQGLKGVERAGAEYDPETGLVTFQVRHADGTIGDSGLAVPYEELARLSAGRMASYGLTNIQRLRSGLQPGDPRGAEMDAATTQLTQAVTAAGGTPPTSTDEFLNSMLGDADSLEVGGQQPTGDPALLAERDALRARIAEQQAAAQNRAQNPGLPTAGRVIGSDDLGSNLRRLNQIEAQLAEGERPGLVERGARAAGAGLRQGVQDIAADPTRLIPGLIGQGIREVRDRVGPVAGAFTGGLLGREAEAPEATADTQAPRRGPMTAEDYITAAMESEVTPEQKTIQLPDGSRPPVHQTTSALYRAAQRPVPNNDKQNSLRAVQLLVSARQLNGGQLPGGAWQSGMELAATGSPVGLSLMQAQLREMELLERAAGRNQVTPKQIMDHQKQVHDMYETGIDNAARVALRGREGSKTYDEELKTLKAGAHMARMELSNEFKLVGMDPMEMSLHPQDYTMIADIATRYWQDNDRIRGHNREASKLFSLKSPKERRHFISYVIKNIQGTNGGNQFLGRMAWNVGRQSADSREEQEAIARKQLQTWINQAEEIDESR